MLSKTQRVALVVSTALRTFRLGPLWTRRFSPLAGVSMAIEPICIVAVDPGEVTGVALWRSDWDDHGRPSTVEVEVSTTVPAVIRRLLSEAEVIRPSIIAVERFHQSPRKTAQPEAGWVTGAVKSLCEEVFVRCVYQNPGPAKKIASDALLRRLGWYVRTKDGHANDAQRHVLLALATHWPNTFAELAGV